MSEPLTEAIEMRIEHGVRPVTYMKTKAAELLSSLRDLVLKRLDADGKPDEGSALVLS